MAGYKVRYKHKIEASTILEVVISMVIILLVFTIAMMISANIMRSSLSAKKLYAQAVLQDLLIKAEQSQEINTQTVNIDDLRIEQEVKPDINFSNLLNIHLTAYDINSGKIAEVQKIVINRNE